MMFYIIVTAVTVSLFSLLVRLKRGSIPYYVIFFLFILIPALIGGMRDFTVGTDLAGYGSEYFTYASFSSSFDTLLTYSPTTEYGYIILNYFCSQIINDISFFLFISEVIKLFLVGIVALHLKNSMNATFFILAYMLFFFFGGFSMMRQQLSLCICLFSLIYYFEKRYIIFSLWIALAWTFHHSAFIMLLLPLTDFLSKRWYSFPLVIFGLYIIYSLRTQLLIFLAESGIVKDVMADRYLDSGVALAKTNILIAVFFLLYSLVSGDTNKWRKRMIMINSIFCIFFLFMSTFFEVAFRVSFYQMVVLMVLVLLSIKAINGNFLRGIYSLVYLFLFILYFFVESSHGLSGTIPYKSEILGLSDS